MTEQSKLFEANQEEFDGNRKLVWHRPRRQRTAAGFREQVAATIEAFAPKFQNFEVRSRAQGCGPADRAKSSRDWMPPSRVEDTPKKG
jgi:hypothetical protein